MRIERKSWHYWLYNFCNEWNDKKESENENFCTYFWKSVEAFLILVWFTLLFLAGIAMLYIFGNAVYYFSIHWFVLGGAAALTGLVFLARKVWRSEKSKSIRAYIYAKKRKICPLIKFEGP